MNKKYIINEGRLKMGLVGQHRELARDHTTTVGGGWWHRDDKQKAIWLYGRSQLFGSVSPIVLRQVIQNGMHDFPGYTFYYHRSSQLEIALAEGERL
ncbi:MAG: hypothetical protein ACOC12_10395 [Bacteroidota bacterium]